LSYFKGSICQELRDRSILVDGSHHFGILTDAIEIRLDYMGSSTLMGRICYLILRLKDDRYSSSNMSPSLPSTLASLNLKWSQLHIMITRSTTPDIILMITKLTEFFRTQWSNPKTLLVSIQHDFRHVNQSTATPKTTLPSKSSKETINRIQRRIGMNGGELVLQGHNLTLIIFHGLNFKSRQWALFSLNEPYIDFVTDRGDKGDSTCSLLSIDLTGHVRFVYLFC
jgi:hypothetical protein